MKKINLLFLAAAVAGLMQACSGWTSAHVLHGTSVTLDNIPFFGVGGGIPVVENADGSLDGSWNPAPNRIFEIGDAVRPDAPEYQDVCRVGHISVGLQARGSRPDIW